MNLLFDSNIVIDALNGFHQGAAELRVAEVRFISIVSWIEVLAGCPTVEAQRSGRALLGRFRILPVSAEIAERTVSIRRTTRLKLPDAVIWATALEHGLQLSTRNTKDFSAVDPTIRVPYEL